MVKDNRSPMAKITGLPYAKAVKIVREIYKALYVIPDPNGNGAQMISTPDTEWDDETIDAVGAILQNAGLYPSKTEPWRG